MSDNRPATADILRRSEERRRHREANDAIDLGPSWAELCKPLSGKAMPKSALMSNQGYEMTEERAQSIQSQANGRPGRRGPASPPKPPKNGARRT